nr:HD domain-containing phosphohydrolase [Pseudohongiella spirulinae]
MTRSQKILVVDDEQSNLKLIVRLLAHHGYNNVIPLDDSRQVSQIFQQERPDLILLDLNMPHLNGFQVLDQLKALNESVLPPVVMLTAQHGRDFILESLSRGARDYISKPFDPSELIMRVQNLLEVHLAHKLLVNQKKTLEEMVANRTRELRETRLQVVQRLGRAAEYRDEETGNHILRMSHTSAFLAEKLGWSADQCELLLHASPMHDIGKIGIPDYILLKPGRLIPDEWEIMKTHAEIGAKLLDGDDSDLMVMAREIAWTHHEKWDGSGYPRALKADQIPVAGRIVAISDVFDALTSERPYKKAWDIERALDYIQESKGLHFDPDLVELFLANIGQILAIRQRFAEP